jgi:hypothetical protein
MSRKNILKRYKADLRKGDKDEEYLDSIIARQGQRFCDYDYNRVRSILAYEDLIIKDKKTTNAFIDTTVWDRHRNGENHAVNEVGSSSISHTNNIFGVDFEKNRVHEVIEYRDDDGITVLIDGELLFRKKEKQHIGS